MGRRNYLGGSTVVRPGSNWFGYGVKKSDQDETPAPRPKNIFKLTAEGRKAQREFIEQLEEERRSLGVKKKKRAAKNKPARRKTKRQRNKKKAK